MKNLASSLLIYKIVVIVFLLWKIKLTALLPIRTLILDRRSLSHKLRSYICYVFRRSPPERPSQFYDFAPAFLGTYGAIQRYGRGRRYVTKVAIKFLVNFLDDF